MRLLPVRGSISQSYPIPYFELGTPEIDFAFSPHDVITTTGTRHAIGMHAGPKIQGGEGVVGTDHG
jgi:hypothetical protein